MSAPTKDATNVSEGSIARAELGQSYQNRQIDSPIHVFEEVVKLSDFVDGGGLTGEYELRNSDGSALTLPIGSRIEQALLDDVTGFAGDTSSVVAVGDGTDVDRYTTGTPDIFSDIEAVDMGVPSGTQFHASEKNVVVTVTSATDFGAITDGKFKITLVYYKPVSTIS